MPYLTHGTKYQMAHSSFRNPPRGKCCNFFSNEGPLPTITILPEPRHPMLPLSPAVKMLVPIPVPHQCLASMAGSTKSFLLPPPKWKTWTEVSLLTSRSGRDHSGTCVHVCTHLLSFTLFCSFKCNNNKSQNTKFKSNLFTTKLSIWALCHKLYPRTSYSVVEQSMSPMQVNCKGVEGINIP